MEEKLLNLWEHEKRSPQWFRDASETARYTDEEYLDWCREHTVYFLGDGKAALFVRRFDDVPELAEIHFSAERGFRNTPEAVKELAGIRGRMFGDGIETVVAWVAKQNRGLRDVCLALGMEYHGFRRFKGETHGKAIEWRCYQLFAPKKNIDGATAIC